MEGKVGRPNILKICVCVCVHAHTHMPTCGDAGGGHLGAIVKAVSHQIDVTGLNCLLKVEQVFFNCSAISEH